MPKRIENIKEQILSAARRQIDDRGYAGLTVRSIAAACGVGVGTVYNYFDSKEMIIASFMIEDWLYIVKDISKGRELGQREVFFSIYSGLKTFSKMYEKLFSDKDALAVFNTVFAERHKILRGQITELILPVISSRDSFTAEFIAESLITWTMNGNSFDDIYNVIKKLI